MVGEPWRPGVSVITVALNAANDLPLTLESVLLQDYPDIEMIVLDGGSWDGTAEILTRYESHVGRLVCRADAGIYHAMNDAADLASKEYLLFLNAGDTFANADAISGLIDGAVGQPDILYGNHMYTDGRVENLKRSAPFRLIAEKLVGGDIDHRWLSLIPGHQATVTRTSILKALRYDTRLDICADHDLLFRAHSQGAEMCFVDEVVAHYVGGGYSARRGDRCRLEWASVYRRFTEHPEAVDRFFYPEGAPFDHHTEKVGLRLTGFYPPEAPAPAWNLGGSISWCAGHGCQVLTPDRDSLTLSLLGYCPFEYQEIDAYCDQILIGSVSVPSGTFDVQMQFSQPVVGSGIVDLVPSRFGEIEEARGRFVGFALKEFRFGSGGVDAFLSLAPGGSAVFGLGNIEWLRRALGIGWSQPEGSHTWSLNDHSELRLKLEGDVSAVRLNLAGNPHVERGQSLRISVNGQTAVEQELPLGEDVAILLKVAYGPWIVEDANRIGFDLTGSAIPPGDTRKLGIRLDRIDAL